MKIEIWSDVACPWCYIGKRRFESALAQFPHRDSVDVEWKSYQLDPSIPEHYDGTELDYLSKRKGMAPEQVKQMFAHVTETAKGEGLDTTSTKLLWPTASPPTASSTLPPPTDARTPPRNACSAITSSTARTSATTSTSRNSAQHLSCPPARLPSSSPPTSTRTRSRRTSTRLAPSASPVSRSSSSTASTASPVPSRLIFSAKH